MTFATADDIAQRRGRTFTEDERAMADLLCEAATAVITDAAGKTDAWADTLDPVPRILKFVAIEVVARVMPNPDGLRSFQEQLGAYSHSESYRDVATGGGLLLTQSEVLLVRRAVWGTTSGSVKVASAATEIADLLYGS